MWSKREWTSCQGTVLPDFADFWWSMQRRDLSKMLELENENKSKDEPKKRAGILWNVSSIALLYDIGPYRTVRIRYVHDILNTSKGEMFCQIISTHQNKADQNVAKTLKLVLCFSRDSLHSKYILKNHTGNTTCQNLPFVSGSTPLVSHDTVPLTIKDTFLRIPVNQRSGKIK